MNEKEHTQTKKCYSRNKIEFLLYGYCSLFIHIHIIYTYKSSNKCCSLLSFQVSKINVIDFPKTTECLPVVICVHVFTSKYCVTEYECERINVWECCSLYKRESIYTNVRYMSSDFGMWMYSDDVCVYVCEFRSMAYRKNVERNWIRAVSKHHTKAITLIGIRLSWNCHTIYIYTVGQWNRQRCSISLLPPQTFK